MPLTLSNYAPRGFGFVHHSRAFLYPQVPNPNLTIRNFCIVCMTGVSEGGAGPAPAAAGETSEGRPPATSMFANPIADLDTFFTKLVTWRGAGASRVERRGRSLDFSKTLCTVVSSLVNREAQG